MLARRVTGTPRWPAILLLLLFLVQLGALLRAPAMWAPEAVTLRLARGESVSLEPLANASILRDAGGRWLLQSPASPAGAPVLQRAGRKPESLASMPIEDQFLTFPGGHRVAREAAGDGSVAFAFAGSSWHYNGAILLRDGRAQPTCPEARWPVRLAAWWNRIAPSPLSLARPLSLGGNLHCGNRIGIAAVLPDAAMLARGEDGALRITALEPRPRALDGVQAIMFGALRLELGADGAGSLVLRPQRRVPQFAAPSTILPAQVEWRWAERALWPQLPDGATQGAFLLALAVTTLSVAALSPGLLSAPAPAAIFRARVVGAVASLGAGLVALALQRQGHAPAPALSLLLAALAVAGWLSTPTARTAANYCAAFLLAIGLLLQLELGLGGSDLRFYQKTSALLAIGLGALSLWRLAPAHWRALAGKQRSAENILLVLAVLALAALAAQVIWGNETGVFDIQPVELAKLALAAITAHCLALRFSWHNGPQYSTTLARWLALAAPVMLFTALLASALLQVDDYSPLVLLLVWAGGSALAYACAAGQRIVAALLLAVCAAGAFGIGALHDAGPAALPSNFYAERFQAWLAPGEHPHTGQQLLRAAGAIAQGGLAGADHAFGLRSAGLPAGEATAIPAVQDDFAPSFFLNRHGLLAGLSLWCLQAAFIACLLWQALGAHRQATASGTYQLAWAARFRCFALCGGAAFVAGHLLLSWGTNLAILPVMGQPMSFLSAGGSHLLFFLLPLLGLSAASNEE
ncbi:FtsW/RodA/SpoVE family cell cycle protein [Pseudoduganella sp. OTU4001]|uniref:FtsW/RodA/SpoVE family cell cycle protein n=1 Tax=Pseudoduganella sp. OTU4001 TaxID=3043854 RepID=UPI00313B7FD1